MKENANTSWEEFQKEKDILGGLLEKGIHSMQEDRYVRAFHVLRASDFVSPISRAIFAKIEELVLNERPLFPSIFAALVVNNSNETYEKQGKAVIKELFASKHGDAEFFAAADLLVEFSIRNSLIQAGDSLGDGNTSGIGNALKEAAYHSAGVELFELLPDGRKWPPRKTSFTKEKSAKRPFAKQSCTRKRDRSKSSNRNTPMANFWKTKNSWFNDPIFSTQRALLLAISSQMDEERCFDPDQYEYFDELNRRMAEACPEIAFLLRSVR